MSIDSLIAALLLAVAALIAIGAIITSSHRKIVTSGTVADFSPRRKTPGRRAV